MDQAPDTSPAEAARQSAGEVASVLASLIVKNPMEPTLAKLEMRVREHRTLEGESYQLILRRADGLTITVDVSAEW